MATDRLQQNPLRIVSQYADLLVVAGVVLIVVMMVVPLPTALLDLLLATNISLAFLILLLAMNVKDSTQFSVFPSLLLVTTLFRLALNVSTTRLILLEGDAGQIIDAFGNYVVGGNMVVGFVVFLILVVIQFIVITKGAERVAEVSARFTLDAMPGKQMSIDADLNSGLIDETEARNRRRSIEQEADFYGAMDGASKFVKGDAIAGIVITLINIIGGLSIGMLQRGLDAGQAVQQYTLLTVGDGLVSQIPALLISTATGILITRAASEGNMASDLRLQLLAQPKVLGVASAILFLFGVMPGMPIVPFWVLAAVVGGVAWFTATLARRAIEDEAAATEEQAAEEERKPDSVMGLLQVDAMELEIGYGLIPLVDGSKGGDLLERITLIRRQFATEMGFVVPPIRIRDNMQLEPNVYLLKIRGVEVGRGDLMPGHLLAMDAGGVTSPVEGIETSEPAFGLAALWIGEERRTDAEQAGYTVVDPPSVLATHLSEVVRRHAPELLGRQDVRQLLDKVKEEAPAVVDEVTSDLLSLGEIQRVLQNLLREGVPIRDLVTILERLADQARVSKDVDILTEGVRAALARQISQQVVGERGYIAAITLDPNIEQRLHDSVQQTEAGLLLAVEPTFGREVLTRLSQAYERAASSSESPVILCASGVRLPLRRLLERQMARVSVVSFDEIVPEVELRAVGRVSLDDASEAV